MGNFFINTVIGHFWHGLPGAYFKRMYGQHFRTGLYGLIDQQGDRPAWDIGKEAAKDVKENVLEYGRGWWRSRPLRNDDLS